MDARSMSLRIFSGATAVSFLCLVLIFSVTGLAAQCVNRDDLSQAARAAKQIDEALQPGEFILIMKGLTFYFRERGGHGELNGVVVVDERDPRMSLTLLAEHARVVLQDGGVYLSMDDGQIMRGPPGKPAVPVATFQSYLHELIRLAGPR